MKKLSSNASKRLNRRNGIGNLLGSASTAVLIAAAAAPAIAQTPATSAAAAAAPQASAGGDAQAASTSAQPADPTSTTTLSEVVVTGSTSKRTLLNASVAVTSVNAAALDQRAPRGTDDILDLIPGIYVEATAGPVSNNYSVRGLPGGGQQFIRLEEDGMPAIYGGLNDDEVFQYDLSIDRVEAVEGGTSGILTENAAGASINFISRELNFDEAGGIARLGGASYGDERADFWYSAPITALGHGVAYAISGYIDSTPGVRDSPFRYQTYHFKGQLEKKFDDGGYIRLTYKRWDEHDPYYADQPYAYENGKIGSVPGLNGLYGNLVGSGFGSITAPDSCYAGECTRTFSSQQGIHSTGNEYRVDFEKKINNSFSVFAKVRYTQTDWDFNGIFGGDGDAAGTAVSYLNPTTGPLASFLQQGLAAFPGTTQFGIKSLTTGQIIPASNTAALNALNGNGLLLGTVLNQQLVKLRDYGSDFGVRYDAAGSNWTNSLTVGGMVYSQQQENDQSGVSTVISDVTNDSNLYDIVGLNAAGGVTGTLSNNGLVAYGDWGSGISNYQQDSQSIYFNDEFTFARKLHIDIGLRYEHEKETANNGDSSPAAVPAGTGGLIQVNNNAFNGAYSTTSGSETPTNYTIGVNYDLTPTLSIYGRYAKSYQTNGTNSEPVGLTLYEAGITYGGYGILGTVRPFRTEFNNQTYGGAIDPNLPNQTQDLFFDSAANGVDLDITYRPTFERLHAFSIHGQLTYQESTISNVSIGTTNETGGVTSSQIASFYNGKIAARTPSQLYSIQPQYDLPHHWGNIYLRYKYTGRIFVDPGNGLALPGYGVLSVGSEINLSPKLQLNVNAENVTNAIGLTEGDPRSGFTQTVANGSYFNGRGIVGSNVAANLTYKF